MILKHCPTLKILRVILLILTAGRHSAAAAVTTAATMIAGGTATTGGEERNVVNVGDSERIHPPFLLTVSVASLFVSA